MSIKAIISERGSGKTKKLLELAREKNALFLAYNKRAIQVKAHNLGFDDVLIIDYEDLNSDNFPLGYPLVVLNGDKFLNWLTQNYYGMDTIGFTATVEKGER